MTDKKLEEMKFMRRRVAEIIHIVPEQKEEFLNKMMKLDQETQQIMWLHGIRRQFFFELGDSILYTFEYHGDNFKSDMEALTVVFDARNMLISKRLRDTPPEERDTTNWWAPLKRLGSNLTTNPLPDDVDEEELETQYRVWADGAVLNRVDTSYDEDDWSESIHI